EEPQGQRIQNNHDRNQDARNETELFAKMVAFVPAPQADEPHPFVQGFADCSRVRSTRCFTPSIHASRPSPSELLPPRAAPALPTTERRPLSKRASAGGDAHPPMRIHARPMEHSPLLAPRTPVRKPREAYRRGRVFEAVPREGEYGI